MEEMVWRTSIEKLLDLYTIYEKYNESFDNLNNFVLFIGDILL